MRPLLKFRSDLRTLRRFLWIVLLSAQFSGCTHPVKVFVPSGAVIHPRFDQPFTNWAGESVQIELAPSLRGEPLRYLTHYDQVFLADALRESGLRHEYKIAGNGTPLVVYSKNPGITPREKHFPLPGIAFGLTAIKKERPGRVPLLKLYDQFDPLVARSGDGLHPIAASYTAILAVQTVFKAQILGLRRIGHGQFHGQFVGDSHSESHVL
jgi:hypothetical protein